MVKESSLVLGQVSPIISPRHNPNQARVCGDIGKGEKKENILSTLSSNYTDFFTSITITPGFPNHDSRKPRTPPFCQQNQIILNKGG